MTCDLNFPKIPIMWGVFLFGSNLLAFLTKNKQTLI